jgi:hypothetical protein
MMNLHLNVENTPNEDWRKLAILALAARIDRQ